MVNLSQIAAHLNAPVLGESGIGFEYLAIDSRRIPFPGQTLFIALDTGRRNGHHFLPEAYRQGVRAFLCSESPNVHDYPQAGFIQVANTLQALQQMAANHRAGFHYPVIGITGSNGKTMVKEWLNQLLQPDFELVRSPKSYNSQIGVPISVWQMNEQHNLAIFEAGISTTGEMEALEKIIQPTIGILTNIGHAHNEGFTSMQQKLQEKLALFTNVEALICCFDDSLIQQAVTHANLPVFSWGHAASNHLVIADKQRQEGHLLLKLQFQQQVFETILPFTDAASFENAMHAITTLCKLGISTPEIVKRVAGLQPIAMRLEWKKAINQCFVLNDAYTNDFSGLIIALDYLRQQKKGDRFTVILSDFAEVKPDSEAEIRLFEQVLSLLQKEGIRRLITVGRQWKQFVAARQILPFQIQSFENTEALLLEATHLVFERENILVKGARVFGLERMVQFLELQSHQTQLEINLSALANNLQVYRSLLKPATRLMVMVKAFGYGSGDTEVARLLQFSKVDYLGVAYADEGAELRKSGIDLPIMVMNPDLEGLKNLETHQLEPEVYSFEWLETLLQYGRSEAWEGFPIHLKIDTGMHRLGFEPHEIDELINSLNNQSVLLVKSVFTHLVASEDPVQDAFTQQQANNFTDACNRLQAALGYTFIRHAANTSAIIRHANKHFDMVRLGIGLFGVVSAPIPLQPALCLKTTVAQVRHLQAGQTVGYNRKGMINRPSKIATVRIGYADGFSRQLGNGVGAMFVRGALAPVIGNVCMDMTMIDVTDIPGVKAGDEVEVFGKNIPIQNLATQCKTITYEIMTSIGQRVKRVYLQE